MYYACRSLVFTSDPNCCHVLRPIDLIHLPSRYEHEESLIVSVFESPGPNYLTRFMDYGSAWYKTAMFDVGNGPQNDNVNESMPVATFMDFAIGAAECIEMLHSQRMIHGEIRGDTFHLDAVSGKVRLLHLGTGARTFDHSLTSVGWLAICKELGAMTRISYMSPEQTGRMFAESDSRTDMYSLGILFWSAITRKAPYERENPLDVLQAVLGQRLPMVSAMRPDIPQAITQVIDKATAKVVSDRYQSMSGMRHDLMEIRELLRAGVETPLLLHWKPAQKDISPFFTLPRVMIGRAAEHATIVEIIDRAFKFHRASKTQEKYCSNHLSRPSEDQSTGVGSNSALGEVLVMDDNRSSAGSSSLSDMPCVGDTRLNKANTGKARSPANSRHSSTASRSEMKSFVKTRLVDSMTGFESARIGDDGSFKLASDEPLIKPLLGRTVARKGLCELVIIGGAAGIGKSRLNQSIQSDARKRGYFASSEFDPAKNSSPYDAMLRLFSSLFRQVFAETNLNPDFNLILRNYLEPVWPTLHKLLGLPNFLLAPNAPWSYCIDSAVQTRPSLARNGDSDYGTRSAQEFLLKGASTKSFPLPKIFLDILQIITRYKLVCLSLDNLNYADEESLELIDQVVTAGLSIVVIVTYRTDQVLSETMKGIVQSYNQGGFSP